jgi:hypothetical protein
MRFDHLDQKAVQDVTANVGLTVLLVAKANHAAIDLQEMVLPVIVLHVMGKADHLVTAEVLEMAKDDLLKDVIRDVDANRGVAMVLRDRGLRAVQWARRILNASWKTRCVLTPTQMES